MGGSAASTSTLSSRGKETEPLSIGLDALDRLGDETTAPHHPVGWAQAGNTPLKWYKKDVHSGGVRDPLIVHWPARINDGGSLRHQYHHVVDVVPTILEILGIDAPAEVRGVPQLPIHGTSLLYTFADASAPTRKQTQYFELIADRALWHRGWKAVTRHEPGTDFAADRWELYHLDEDYAEGHDLAAEEPARLRELIELWWAEAGANNVLPFDDRESNRTAADGPPQPRRVFTYTPRLTRVERWNTPNIANRSYSITADVDIPAEGADGVLLAAGSRFGGYTLFIKDGRLVHEYNAGHERYTIVSKQPIPAGAHQLRFEFAKTGDSSGRGTLLLDGTPIREGDLPRTWRINPARAELHCGRDGGSPISDAYQCPFSFTGTVHQVTVTLSDDQRRDPQAELRAALAED